MINDAFVQALWDKAEEEGSDAALATIRDDCMAKIAGGGGEVAFVTRAGQNGKTGEQTARMDATELLGNVNQALRLFRDQVVTLTYTDFSGPRL